MAAARPLGCDRLPRRPGSRRGFYAEIRRYWPGLRDDALQPAYSGVRPSSAGRAVPRRIFVVQGPVHGIAGLVNLFGIRSPGLTAPGAIADEVLASIG